MNLFNNVESNNPKVGIIILNYINYRLTLNCIESIENQKYDNCFIVVVDNNSPNDSMAVLGKKIKEYYSSERKIFLYNTGNNGGYAFGCNYGIKKAEEFNAEYILILNNDTILKDDNIISTFVAHLMDNIDVALAGPGIIENGQLCMPFLLNRPHPHHRILQLVTPRLSKKLGKYFYKNEIFLQNQEDNRAYRVYSVHGSCMFFRLSCMKEIRYFDANIFLFGEELIIGEKLYSRNFKVHYLPYIKINHLQSATTKEAYSNINKFKTMFKNEMYYYKNYRKDVWYFTYYLLWITGGLRFYIYMPLIAKF